MLDKCFHKLVENAKGFPTVSMGVEKMLKKAQTHFAYRSFGLPALDLFETQKVETIYSLMEEKIYLGEYRGKQFILIFG